MDSDERLDPKRFHSFRPTRTEGLETVRARGGATTLGPLVAALFAGAA